MTEPRRARLQHAPQRAAIFVDYANLHALLARRLDEPAQASSYIAEALRELRRYLSDEDGADTVLTTAHADFSALGTSSGGESLQATLYNQGIEPRFVPTTAQGSAAEVQLAVEATALLHRRPDVASFALVTGDRTFLPLVQGLRRQGAHVLVAALDPPPPEAAHGADDVFMDLLNLLSDAARRALLQSGEMPPRREDGTPSAAAARTSPAYDRLDDDLLDRTLEITEEHFGQYDEVYLTPLLRKLSDVLGEHVDPKALISNLEDAGAVRLEKRRGYPYDYTVLIVNHDHPDVQEMEDAFYGGQRSYEHGSSSSYRADPIQDPDGRADGEGSEDADESYEEDGAPY